MPQFRKDVITLEWVIIAEERAKRPTDFKTEETEPPDRPEQSETCPFCAGNENMTPPEVLAYRKGGSANSSNWWVRVVPNLYPALAIEGGLNRAGVGMYDTMNGVGAHEIIIETPIHNKTLAILGVEAIQDYVWACRERYLDLRKDPRFEYIIIFRNHGRVAGASLEHPHSQLIATPIVPIEVTQELRGFRRYQDFRERCVLCDMIIQELDEGNRIVLENEYFLVVEPFAARFPFETWVLPKQHKPSFIDMTPEEVEQFASILKGTLVKIRACLDRPPYNFTLHIAPCGQESSALFHWHLEIYPRLAIAAGFEMGSGIYINVVPPEQAAAFLREAMVTPEEPTPAAVSVGE